MHEARANVHAHTQYDRTHIHNPVQRSPAVLVFSVHQLRFCALRSCVQFSFSY